MSHLLGSPLAVLNCKVAIQGTNMSTSDLQQVMMAGCVCVGGGEGGGGGGLCIMR